MTIQERVAKGSLGRGKQQKLGDRNRRAAGSAHRKPEARLTAATTSPQPAPTPMLPEPQVQVMKASEFKAKCLGLMDHVAAGKGDIVITKNGRAVSRLVPAEEPKFAPIGRYRDWIEIVGDIVAPVEVEWEAETNPDRVLNP